MTPDKLTRLHHAPIAQALLRAEPLRSEELARCLGVRMRTVQRVLTVLRNAGKWCRAHGLPWWTIETEVRGRERWHRLVDRPAENRRKP